MTETEPFNKAEVEEVDRLIDEHKKGHRIGNTPCYDGCRLVALMIAINVVIEERNEKMIQCPECGGVGGYHILTCSSYSSKPSAIPTTGGVDVEVCSECGMYNGVHLGGCTKYGPQPNRYDERTNAERERDEAIHELTEALRFTVEYVGIVHVPPIVGWSWYDAMIKYAPAKAELLRRRYEMSLKKPEELTKNDGVSD